MHAGGVRGSKYISIVCSALQVWAAVDRRLGIPLNATWAMTALAFLIGLPLLHSEETFFALASISSVGLNLSCEGPPLTCKYITTIGLGSLCFYFLHCL